MVWIFKNIITNSWSFVLDLYMLVLIVFVGFVSGIGTYIYVEDRDKKFVLLLFFNIKYVELLRIYQPLNYVYIECSSCIKV